jgi:hypothetical protein
MSDRRDDAKSKRRRLEAEVQILESKKRSIGQALSRGSGLYLRIEARLASRRQELRHLDTQRN